MIMVTDTR